jgi:iron complex transport system substrate-binding protein
VASFLSLLISGLSLVNIAIANELPQRITSISQCTDVFAVNLADTEQIQSLTFLSADPEESLISDQAKEYSLNVGSTEDAILTNPDLVLAGPWTDPFVLSQLEKLQIPIGKHGNINNLESLQQEYLKVGEWVGKSEKAQQQLNDFMNTVTAVSEPPLAKTLRYVVFGTGGYIGGTNSLQSDIFSKMGLVNIAKELRVEYGGFISVETLILSQPDIIFIPQYRPDSPSIKAALAKHPAMQFLISRSTLIEESSILWRCFNPELNDYLHKLRKQLNTVVENNSSLSKSPLQSTPTAN